MIRWGTLMMLLILLGCATGMERMYPAAPTEVDTSDVRSLFESQGFRLRRALDRGSTTLSYMCATRYFLIQFAEQDALATLQVAQNADSIYEEISEWLRFHLQTPVNVIIFPFNQKEIRYKANSRIVGFSGGRYGTIYLTPADAPHTNRFAHRLGKLFLRRVVHDQPVPWWFMAGMAGYLAYRDELDPIFKRQIAQQTQQLGLRGWNEMAQTGTHGEHPPEMAMASLSTIIFLAERYGEDKLRTLLGTYSREFYRYTFRELFEEHYKPQRELEDEWRQFLLKFAPPDLKNLRIDPLPESRKTGDKSSIQ